MDERSNLDQALLVLNPVIDQVVPMGSACEDQAAFLLNKREP